MSAWVFPVSAGTPENVAIAFEHRQWGMKQNRSVESGDLIYFWQSSASFVALGMATTDTFAAEPSDAPWNDGVRYTHRFGLELVSDVPTSAPSWSQVKEDLGIEGSIQGPRSFAKAQEVLLRSYFEPQGGSSGIFPSVPTQLSDRPFDVPEALKHTPDLEDVVKARREGRAAFKRALNTAYAGQCAVTGTDIEGVLDAAHIVGYRGPLTNHVRNGLLLRVDIHRLFDRGLLDIRLSDASPSGYSVHLDPALAQDPTYGALDGEPLRIAAPHDGPDPKALEQHRKECRQRAKVQCHS